MILETCLTLLTVAERATKLYDWFTGVMSGEKMKATVHNLSDNHSKVERLSDRVLYAPDLQQAINNHETRRLNDKKEIYDLVNPVAEALETDVLASAIISTPDKLKNAFLRDPWELLLDIRPANRTKKPTNPDLIPISFHDGGLQYIGWQTRGALPSLFDCDFEQNGNILVPSNKVKQPVELSSRQTTVERPFQTDVFRPNIGEKPYSIVKELSERLPRQQPGKGFYVFPYIPKDIESRVYSRIINYKYDLVICLIDCSAHYAEDYFIAFCLDGVYYRSPSDGNHPTMKRIDYYDFVTRYFTAPAPNNHVSLGGGALLDCSGSKMTKNEIVYILEIVKQILRKII